MFECHLETISSTGRASIFDSKIFLSNLQLKITIYCVTDQPPIARSRRSALNFKFSVLTFLRSMSCSMSIEQNLCEEKIFQLQAVSNAIRCIDQRFVFKNSGISCRQESWYILSGLDIQFEQSDKDKPARIVTSHIPLFSII